MGAWWPSRSSKPVKPRISAWRVRFPSVSAIVGRPSFRPEGERPMPEPDRRRRVPRMDAVLADERVDAAIDRLGRPTVRALAEQLLERVRTGNLSPERVV